MRQFRNLGLAVFALSFLLLSAYPPASSVVIDTNESTIVWKGYKVTGEHTGTIGVKEGALEFDGDELIGGTFLIDMRSIDCTDLSGGTKDKLVGHLKSDDFFGVQGFPTASFAITKVVSRGTPGDYKITGDLSIKETTAPITFLAKVTEENGKKVAVADIQIDRSVYNVRYGSGSFFDNLGDKTIYDEFDLTVKLVSKAVK